MPRNYQRKTKKGNWTSDTLKRAIQSIHKKELSIRSASQRFNIPFTTLQNRLKKNNDRTAKFGRKAVLSFEQEKTIAEHLLKLSRMFYGLTKIELRRTVYSYVMANNIPNSFSQTTKMAGRDWLKGFLKRNKKISVRKPEATSINRITAFNKPAVSRFYENLEVVMKTHNFQPDRIFNVDETGLTTVHEPAPILAEKGVKQVGAATSGERGKTHTACCCVSASGFYVPPMIIFPRVRMSPKLMIDGPPGAIYRCSKSGWMNETLFLEWLEHFVKKTNASKDDPVLLVMDNHTSHVSIESYDFCIANGIYVVTLAPHTSHKCQPLDRTVFGPLQGAFDVESETEMKEHAFQKLTSEQIPSLLRKAWTKICSTEKAVNGFQVTGIYPFNPNVFLDHEFYQLEPEELEEINEPEEPVAGSEESSSELDDNDEEMDETTVDYGVMDSSETVYAQYVTAEPNTEAEKVVDKFNESVEEISFLSFAPLPQKQKTTKNNRGRPKQLSEIMTSPVYKIILEEKRRKKDIREQKKATAILNRKIKGERSDASAAKKSKKTSAQRTKKIKTDDAETFTEKSDSSAKKPKKTFAKRAKKIETGDAEIFIEEQWPNESELQNQDVKKTKVSSDSLEYRALAKNKGDEPSTSSKPVAKNYRLKKNCKEPRNVFVKSTTSKVDGVKTPLSARKRRKSPTHDSNKDQLLLSSNENCNSKKTKVVESSSVDSSDQQKGASDKTAKRRRVAVKEDENCNSKKTKVVESSLVDSFDQQKGASDKTAKRRRVAVKEDLLQLARPGLGRKKSTKVTKKSTQSINKSGENFQLNELLDGLCFLCGEKYQAEFFVCAECSNCVHIGCSSEQAIADQICSDCTV